MSNVRVLIVNDSPTMRLMLRLALEADPIVEVVGEVVDGVGAADAVIALRPNVVLMDVVMPKMSGYEATREIMRRAPTPIVLVSSVVNPRDAGVALETCRAGALAIVEAPPSPGEASYEARRASFVMLVRAMANVKLTRNLPAPVLLPGAARPRAAVVSAIGIAASVGGPAAVCEVLAACPARSLPPILLVQHMARGFAVGFAAWLADVTKHTVTIARHGDDAQHGVVYVPPDDRHIGITSELRLQVSDEPAVGPFRPSATHLFLSLARALGPRAAGVVLTGMGDDAADGAVALRSAGGEVVAQDEASSVVFGMPRAAFERGGVDRLLPLLGVSAWLRAIAVANPRAPS